MLLAKFIHQRQKSSVWHIDVTGSVVNAFNDKPIYYYVIVMENNDSVIPALPVYKFITNSHNDGNLKIAFVAWLGHLHSVGVRPDTIVFDLSWALFHSTLFAFCEEDINDLL